MRTRRTVTTVTQVTSSTTTASPSTSTTSSLSSTIAARGIQQLSISAIVGITLACLLACSLLTWMTFAAIRIALIRSLLLETGLRQQLLSIPATSTTDSFDHQNTTPCRHYKLATRSQQRKSFGKYSTNSAESSLQEILVDTSL